MRAMTSTCSLRSPPRSHQLVALAFILMLGGHEVQAGRVTVGLATGIRQALEVRDFASEAFGGDFAPYEGTCSFFGGDFGRCSPQDKCEWRDWQCRVTYTYETDYNLARKWLRNIRDYMGDIRSSGQSACIATCPVTYRKAAKAINKLSLMTAVANMEGHDKLKAMVQKTATCSIAELPRCFQELDFFESLGREFNDGHVQAWGLSSDEMQLNVFEFVEGVQENYLSKNSMVKKSGLTSEGVRALKKAAEAGDTEAVLRRSAEMTGKSQEEIAAGATGQSMEDVLRRAVEIENKGEEILERKAQAFMQISDLFSSEEEFASYVERRAQLHEAGGAEDWSSLLEADAKARAVDELMGSESSEVLGSFMGYFFMWIFFGLFILAMVCLVSLITAGAGCAVAGGIYIGVGLGLGMADMVIG